jgi:hypothetical protein
MIVTVLLVYIALVRIVSGVSWFLSFHLCYEVLQYDRKLTCDNISRASLMYHIRFRISDVERWKKESLEELGSCFIRRFLVIYLDVKRTRHVLLVFGKATFSYYCDISTIDSVSLLAVGIAAAVATLAGYTSGLLYGFSLRVLFTGSLYGFTLRVLYSVPLFGQFIRNYCTHILSIYMGPVALQVDHQAT